MHTTCFSCVHFVVRKNDRPLQVKLENGRSGIQDDFQTRKHIEKLHSTRKQGRRIYNVCICKQCFRLYKNTFCVAKCLLGKRPKPLCSAFFNAGCASRRDAFYPVMLSGSLRTCTRCDAASAREAYFICSGTGASRSET